MKRLRSAAAAVAFLMAIVLSGCDAAAVYEVKLPDGRTVTCAGAGKGASCDWSHAR